MKSIFDTAMRNAGKLTQCQHVIEATRVIQRALSGRNPAPSMEQQPAEGLRLIEPEAGARPAKIEQPVPGNRVLAGGSQSQHEGSPARHGHWGRC